MNGWVSLHRGELTDALQEKHPTAFLLLCQVARRARLSDCPITKLKAGQAFIGDWRGAGISSQKSYRHAKNVLQRAGIVAFQGANKGTIATLIDQRIFSISREGRGEQGGEQEGTPGATKGRTRGDQGATNKKERMKEGEDFLLEVEASPIAKKGKPTMPSTALMIRIGKFFKRRESTNWNTAEIAALKEIGEPDEEDLQVLECFYLAEIDKPDDKRRHSLEALLKNWNGELDKARIFAASKPIRPVARL